jgi:hypothetical protein
MRRPLLRLVALIGLAGQLQPLPATMACGMHHRMPADCASGHHGPGPVVRAASDVPAAPCASMPCCGGPGSVFVAPRAGVDDVAAAGPAALAAPVLAAPTDVAVFSTSPPPKV